MLPNDKEYYVTVNIFDKIKDSVSKIKSACSSDAVTYTYKDFLTMKWTLTIRTVLIK